MNTILIGSLTSPYVRKLRLLLNGLEPYELKCVNYLEKNDNEYLKSVNPINKLPVYIDNGVKIYDSRVIYNYLANKHNLKKFSLHEENILSAIDAAMDSSISLFSYRRGGLNLNGGNAYVERQMERIPTILNYISHWASEQDEKNPAHWNFLTMSLYSYLYWGQFREILDLNKHPVLKKFLERFKNAPGVAVTNPS
ncbi:MAG: glutathione S-transferase family protein [Bacteriovorax sp.]|jgi:glutathione S-transferase